MGILGVVALGVTIFATMFGIANSIDQAQQSENQFNQSQELAEKSLETQKDIADQNFGLSEKQFEYQKQLNELQMQREDTAMQRQVADLKAAGLSPLMAGSGSPTGNLVSASAPSYDGSGILGAMSNLLGVKQDYASRKQAAYQFERQQAIQTAQTYSDLISSRLQNKKLSAEIEGIKINNEYNRVHGPRDPNAASALADYLMSYIDSKGGVGNALDNFPTDAKDVSKKAEEGITNLLKDAAQEKIDKTKEMYNSVKNTVSEYTPQPVKDKVNSLKETVKSKASSAKTAVVSGIKSGYQKVKNKYNEYKNKKKK